MNAVRPVTSPRLNPSFPANDRERGTNAFMQGDWLHSPTPNTTEFSNRAHDALGGLRPQV